MAWAGHQEEASGDGDATLPSGSVAFLFTDVEGSTVLWERHREAMAVALEAHDRVLQKAAVDHGGYVFSTAGDSFAIAFRSPADAMAAAVEAQLALMEPVASLTIKVRMGIHSGMAIVRDGDYFGPVLNRAARLMAVGHGGQILVSGAVRDAVSDHMGNGLDLADLGEHQLKDLSRAERVFQLQHPRLESHFPPLRSIRTTSTNLPVQLTSFVGRERELAEAGSLLAGTRLLTMTGTGGAGKTRLAMQLGAELLDDFPGGVRLVELAPLSDPELVADQVAKALGVALQPDRLPVETIAGVLGDRSLLLILDNCEHLVDAVAALAEELLMACPGVKILATSIELLRVPGEVAYRLPSLALPDADEDLDAVRNRDAVRLFTERAIVAKPDFAVTHDNVAAVVAITQRLDGMPLGLELAAARLRTLSVGQIAERLDERFRLLTGGQRTRVERHQTLQAAIDWSYELLTESERVLFRRMSVFTGNFTLGALTEVCCGDPLDPLDVVDLTSDVVDKSMVATEDGPDGETRYRLLETLRRYGWAKLADAGEAPATQTAHLEYYTRLAARLDEMYLEHESARAMALLAADQANIRAALTYALSRDQVEDAARIIERSWFLWYHSGRSREAVDWGRDLFAKNPELPDDLLAGVLHGHGTLLGIWDLVDAGIEMLRREVELRRQMDDPASLGSALNNLGNLLRDRGRSAEAEAVFSEAIEVRRDAGLPAHMQLISLAEVALNAESYETADAQYSQALEEAAAEGDAYGIALAKLNLGHCAVCAGEPARSTLWLQEARQAFGEQGVRPGVAEADFFLALAARAEGRRSDAAHLLLASLDAADAHWTASLTSWNLQVAATVVHDSEVGAELLGAIGSDGTRGLDAQPPYFERDFAAAVDQLKAVLGEERFRSRYAAGASRSFNDSVAAARYALREEVS